MEMLTSSKEHLESRLLSVLGTRRMAYDQQRQKEDAHEDDNKHAEEHDGMTTVTTMKILIFPFRLAAGGR